MFLKKYKSFLKIKQSFCKKILLFVDNVSNYNFFCFLMNFLKLFKINVSSIKNKNRGTLSHTHRMGSQPCKGFHPLTRCKNFVFAVVFPVLAGHKSSK